MSASIRSTRAAKALLLALALSSCAPARSLFMSAGEYQAYRSTRIGATLEDRLAAAARYLELYPEGEYATSVRAYFEEAEPVFYASKKGSVAGLEAYLMTLPHGARTEEVRADLEALRSAKEEREDLRGATEMGARLSALTDQRTRVRTELEAWIRRFLRPVVWEKPISEAPEDLIIAWSLGLPSPVCSAGEGSVAGQVRRCSKILELPYTVTGSEGAEERQATIEIALEQDQLGRPIRVTIGGPDLFLRYEETFAARAIAHDDAARKAAATSKVMDLILLAADEALAPAADCKLPPSGSAPSYLRFECKGLRVAARASSTGAEDDSISITKL